MAEEDQLSESDYEVGYGRPPKETRFKPGDRGNPKGRPKGSQNKKDQIEAALNQKVSVRIGGKIKKKPAIRVIVDRAIRDAADGDYRAAAMVIKLKERHGVSRPERLNSGPALAPEPTVAARGNRPSDALLKDVDDSLLSQAEKVELSKLLESIDAGGEIVSLDGDDFMRLKRIVNKGRGKNVEPAVNVVLDSAA